MTTLRGLLFASLLALVGAVSAEPDAVPPPAPPAAPVPIVVIPTNKPATPAVPAAAPTAAAAPKTRVAAPIPAAQAAAPAAAAARSKPATPVVAPATKPVAATPPTAKPPVAAVPPSPAAATTTSARTEPAAPTAVDTASLAAPDYTAEACCHLCPRVADPKNYLTNYLVNQKFLFEGNDGWIFRSELDMKESFDPEEEGLYDDLARMQRAFKARGTDVVLVVVPPRGLINVAQARKADLARYDVDAAAKSYLGVLARLRNAGFIVPDPSRFFNEPADHASFFFKRDDHWTPDGSRRAAAWVAESLRALPSFKTIPAKGFETKRIGVSRVYGAISLIASAMCGGSYPEEVVPKYETKATGGTSAEDLFGDVPVPSVTLVGTSMSANPNYHFHGFLQSTLQVDILNAAKSGGSIDGAMTEYLLSESYRQHPPKVLIWEFVIQQFTVAHHNTLRRLVPLVGNGCSGKPALLENTVTLKPGDDLAEVLYNGGGGKTVDQPSKELVADVQLEDTRNKELLAESWFLDGKSDQLRVRYNDFTEPKGRFVFELSDSPEHAEQPLVVLRAQLGPLAPGPTVAHVTVCAETVR